MAPEGEAVAYRVVQEAVTNAVRHSGAAHLTVRLGPVAGGLLQVAVDDDGKGPAGGVVEGNGLRGMRERLAGVDGTVDLVELQPGLGVHAAIPLAAGAPTTAAVPKPAPHYEGSRP